MTQIIFDGIFNKLFFSYYCLGNLLADYDRNTFNQEK